MLLWPRANNQGAKSKIGLWRCWFWKDKVTRGDGIQGDDVTVNVKTIPTVPLILKGNYPNRFEARGEIVMPLKGLKKLNEERVSNDEEPFKNTRNTSAH